jgi:hypothetical protein
MGLESFRCLSFRRTVWRRPSISLSLAPERSMCHESVAPVLGFIGEDYGDTARAIGLNVPFFAPLLSQSSPAYDISEAVIWPTSLYNVTTHPAHIIA